MGCNNIKDAIKTVITTAVKVKMRALCHVPHPLCVCVCVPRSPRLPPPPHPAQHHATPLLTFLIPRHTTLSSFYPHNTTSLAPFTPSSQYTKPHLAPFNLHQSYHSTSCLPYTTPQHHRTFLPRIPALFSLESFFHIMWERGE